MHREKARSHRAKAQFRYTEVGAAPPTAYVQSPLGVRPPANGGIDAAEYAGGGPVTPFVLQWCFEGAQVSFDGLRQYAGGRDPVDFGDLGQASVIGEVCLRSREVAARVAVDVEVEHEPVPGIDGIAVSGVAGRAGGAAGPRLGIVAEAGRAGFQRHVGIALRLE